MSQQIKNSVQQRIRDNWKTIKSSVPEGVNANRLIAIAVSALDANPGVAKCSFDSIISAVTLAATVGIEPNDGTGRAWFIPRKGKLQYELGFKGHAELMYQSGRVALVEAHSVFENDTFEAHLGTDPSIVHKPAMKDRGDLIGAYAVVWLHGSNRTMVEVITQDDMTKIRDKSPARSGPWFEWPEEMARAKAIRRVSKRAPIDAIARRALVALDEAEARIPVESVLGKDAWDAFRTPKEASQAASPPPENEDKKDLGTYAEEPPEDWQPKGQEKLL